MIAPELDFESMRLQFVEMQSLLDALPDEQLPYFRQMLKEKFPDPGQSVVICEKVVPTVGASRVVVYLEPSVAFGEVMAALRAAQGMHGG